MKRLLICIILCISINQANAQKRRKVQAKPSGQADFLKTQCWLAIRSGINFTNVNPLERHPGFYPINYSEDLLDKAYENFTAPAFHVGLDITFYHAGFSVSTFPSFYKHNMVYKSTSVWLGNTASEQYESIHNIEQSVTFIDLPLAIKSDILKNNVRPFVVVGALYSFIFDANKSVQIQEVDYASGNALTYDRTTLCLNNEQDFLNNWGVLGGTGASFDFWNIRTIIDIQYRHSLTTIVEPTSRYTETIFSAFGEIVDNYKLANFSGSISFVFPLRYIDNQLKAL